MRELALVLWALWCGQLANANVSNAPITYNATSEQFWIAPDTTPFNETLQAVQFTTCVPLPLSFAPSLRL